MGDFGSMNGMKRMMGLKGPTNAQRDARARKRRLTKLSGDEIEELESSVGLSPEESKDRRKRRRAQPVFASLLGNSSAERLGG